MFVSSPPNFLRSSTIERISSKPQIHAVLTNRNVLHHGDVFFEGRASTRIRQFPWSIAESKCRRSRESCRIEVRVSFGGCSSNRLYQPAVDSRYHVRPCWCPLRQRLSFVVGSTVLVTTPSGVVVLGNPDLIDKVEVDLIASLLVPPCILSPLRFLIGVLP